MTVIPVFWMEPTELQRVWLRRYRAGCPVQLATKGYCNAMSLKYDQIDGSAPLRGDLNDTGGECPPDASERAHWAAVSEDDPAWPTRCDHCGGAFHDTEDVKQVFSHRLYSGAPGGQLYTLYDCPVGALWDADWMGEHYRGPDGLHLAVRTPGGTWLVDGEASNCTRPQREVRDGRTFLTDRTHYCWVRHGDPKAPSGLHVDKDGTTCAAGAGSIQIGGWHGFLHRGHLVPC